MPPDLLRRVLDPREKLVGTLSEDYGLPEGERLTEVITPAWNRLRKHWLEFRAAAESLPPGEAGTGLTNDKWSLPLLRELGFGLLPTTVGPEVGGRTYAISRFFGSVPVHLVGCGLSLDRRAAGVRGAAAANPHGLVQEFLNRGSGHLWGIVGNGLLLRILRDSQTLSRQSFLEFDLETMFTAESYSDFVLLWLVVHATRFVPRDGDRPETCWLEVWTKEAEEQGTRALGDLRIGVERALQILGQGFTSHPNNAGLRDQLRTGHLLLTEFHGQLLRVIYRLIFLFVGEDRTIDGQPLLHTRDTTEAAALARRRYAAYYSTARLRELASTIKGSRHTDLWRQFQLIVGALSGGANFSSTRDHLGLPTLGSFLWDPDSTAVLNNSELTNYDLLDALRQLAFTRQGMVLRPVDFRNLGAEELGGVYESLLVLTPQISADGAHFAFAEFAGNERKSSGSYYTPDSLVQSLLDSALNPVVDAAIKGKTGLEAEKAILALKICDPAVGSGHFLVGAAHRLARHLSSVRAHAQGEGEASPLFYQHALRDVIGRCLYGVDVSPMAAELCRVSLWLEALDPGKPLSFLDHHIRVGNSLLGATPHLIAGGLPDEAFIAIKGDDKKACALLKRRNKAERKGVGPLFAEQDAELQVQLQRAAAALDELPDDRPEDIKAKELVFRRHEQTAEYLHKRHLADTWCAAFVIRKYFSTPGREASASGLTQSSLSQRALGGRLPDKLDDEISRLAMQYHFFHWHLAFPEVFADGGFDVVLGNPPWEQTELREKEWFSERRPDIANARTGAERKRLINAIEHEDPVLFAAFADALREHEATSHFLGDSGRYPLCGRGRINTYAVFAEAMRNLVGPSGRLGCVLPSGIATDDTTKLYFRDVVASKSLVSLYDFENKGMFPDVDSRYRFCLFTSGSGTRPIAAAAEFVFFAHRIEDLVDPERRFSFSADDISLINPNTRTCLLPRTRADAELVKRIYLCVPVLIEVDRGLEGNPWGLDYRQGLFNMTSDSALFRSAASFEASAARRHGRNWIDHDHQVWVPLYEAKMIDFYDYRAASYAARGDQRGYSVLPETSLDDHCNPAFEPEPFYWVREGEVDEKLSRKVSCNWLLGFKNVARSTDERTFICSLLPKSGVGHSLQLMFSDKPASLVACLVANLSSLVLDYVARQKVGGINVSFFYVNQFAVLPPTAYSKPDIDFIVPRVLELSYTSDALRPLAQDLGYDDAPFPWDPARRALLRAELDAYIARRYGLGRDDLRYILDPSMIYGEHYPSETFRVLQEREIREVGEFRTARLILEAWDRLDDQRTLSSEREYKMPSFRG